MLKYLLNAEECKEPRSPVFSVQKEQRMAVRNPRNTHSGCTKVTGKVQEHSLLPSSL